MALRIFGVPRSRATRTLWCAKELDLDYELVRVAQGAAGTGSAAFAQINPNARIPAIEDDGQILTESMAINLYLAKKAGRLYPTDPRQEALLMQWTFWAVTDLELQLMQFLYNTKVWSEPQRNSYLAASLWAGLDRPFKVLDAALADRPYLLGDQFALADLNVAGMFFVAHQLKVDFSAWPRMKAWLDRCLERPAAVDVRKMREAG